MNLHKLIFGILCCGLLVCTTLHVSAGNLISTTKTTKTDQIKEKKDVNVLFVEAIRNKDYDAVKAALQAGADPDTYSDPEFYKFCLGRGWSYQITTSKTILYEETKNNSFDMVKLLLNLGAKKDLNLALILAIEKGNLDMVKLLLSKADPNTCENVRPYFHVLNIAGSRIDIINLLMDKGANPNFFVMVDGYLPPLHRAIQQKKYKAVELLLERGADPNLSDNNRTTPLEWARRSGPMNNEFVILLQKFGAK